MSSDNNREERNMVGKAISKTYKGILRVANNLNLIDYTTDTFLSKEYYTDSTDTKFYGQGIDGTFNFLNDTADTKRFKNSNDEYINLKLPVTDSMGNFMNFALGTDSSVIGFNAEIGNYKEGDNFNFSIVSLDKNPLYIGLEERKNSGEKGVSGGSLYIDDSQSSNGSIVIKNNFIHNGREIVETTDPIRTVFASNLSSGLSRKFDFFYYSQENYNYDSINNSAKFKDCQLSIKNLSDLIHTKTDTYLSTTGAPVPTGTIINQYCSLDKWYCYDASSNEIDDFGDISKSEFDGWQGYRPSMYNTSGTYAYFNLINNRAISTDAHLKYNGKRTTELPPDFKRGYILCDGGPVTFKLAPSSAQGKDNEQNSLRLFFDLFYFLGYYYHNNKRNLPRFHQCVKQSDGTYRYNNYTAGYEPHRVSWANVNYDVVYAITMATVLMFKALDDQYSKNKNSFASVNDVLSWLKTQEIPDEYVFNAVTPSELTDDSLQNNYFKYNNSSLGSKEFYINIGREINSFSDKIPYYEYDETNQDYKLTSCEIWKTAEAQHLASLFINYYSQGTVNLQGEWDTYEYTFYVPQLYTQTDNDANAAAALWADSKIAVEVKVSSFLGSNGLLAAKSLTIKDDSSIEITLEQEYSHWQSNFRNYMGYTPHVHAVGKGRTTLIRETLGASPEGASLPNNLTQPKLNGNIIDKTHKEEQNNTVIKTDYRGTQNITDKIYLPADPMNNYVLFEVQSATWNNVSNSFSGTYGKELSNGTTYKWYGRSSEPIWIENGDISNNTKKFENQNTYVGYFKPESIKLLPLIKL